MISTRRFFTVAIVFLVFLCPSAPVRADDKPAKAPVPEIKVRFDARFISVSPAQLQKIDVPIPKDGALVSADEENRLIRGIHSLEHASTMALPAVRAALGHQESTMCLQQQAYVSGWTEPKADGKRQAKISTAQSGVRIDVCPIATGDNRFVVVFLHPCVSQLQSLTEVPWDKAPQEHLKIQKADMIVRELNTILWIPDGATLLLHLKGDEEQLKKLNRESGVPLDTAMLLLLKPTVIK